MAYNKLGEEYLLLKELGVGGFAKVYKAKNLRHGYIRAIRVLNEYVETDQEKIYQNFLRECGILLRLGNGCHPNIVRLYQPCLVAGRAFVEMDWVDGIDLRKLIEQHGGLVPMEETVRMVREIGSALAYCHHDIYKVCYDKESDNLQDADDGSALITSDDERRLIEKYRVIHNDIHTGNIMRRSDGTYILLDFGLAVDGNSDIVTSSRRRQGAIEFLSAQRMEGLDPTPQDDIYAFGCVLYAMLAGKPPFPIKAGGKGISVQEEARLLTAHKSTPPPPIERSDIPQWLFDITMRCLAKQPSDRYADGHELYLDIHSQEERERTTASQESLWMRQKIESLEQENVQSAITIGDLHSECEKKDNVIDYLEKSIDEKNHIINTLTSEVNGVKMNQNVISKTEVVMDKQSKADSRDASGPNRPSWLVTIILSLAVACVTVLLMFFFKGHEDVKPNEEDIVDIDGWVDLGLPSGNLWATCNIGASSPEERGDYFAWGETSTKKTYSWDNYLYGRDKKKLTKYCGRADYGKDGFSDKLNKLQPGDDIAVLFWGDGAAIPTQKDWQELQDNTTAEWTIQNGVSGLRLTAKNGNSIFLPAAGCSSNERTNLRGFYWSSTLVDGCPGESWIYSFIYDKDSPRSYLKNENRYYGFSIRPVCPAGEKIPNRHIDLGLPSGKKWATTNEEGFYTYDSAVSKFGKKLPTRRDWMELKENCEWTWIDKSCKVTSYKNGKSITLPALGGKNCNGDIIDVQNNGYYWASTIYDSDTNGAWSLDFNKYRKKIGDYKRCVGMSVRLVQK